MKYIGKHFIATRAVSCSWIEEDNPEMERFINLGRMQAGLLWYTNQVMNQIIKNTLKILNEER